MHTFKKSFLAITTLILLSMGLLSGCNTVQGVGKDVQAGGKAIQRAGQH
ncbi:MAG: entericidin A/B family lipoprotein [Proteobacteria bacterium]|nr:entericidin A/B family lipoprotein [Pseudomonadota bacterium]